MNILLIIEVVIFIISFIAAQCLSAHWHKVQPDIKWSQTGICFLVMFGPDIIFNLVIKLARLR